MFLKNEKDRNCLFNFLKKKNIQCNFHYIPLYRHPFYEVKKKFFTRYHDSEIYYKKALSLPIHPGISIKQVKIISRFIRAYFKK